MVLFRRVLLFAITLGLIARKMQAQKEASQTEANECRHVAILASDSTKTSYTARCYIPTKRIHSPTDSLFNMIPKEWRWVYEHNGSVSGQVLVRTKNSVYILSQKDCLDSGRARGRPIRSVYGIIGGNSPRTDVYGDFDWSKPSNRDAYSECVFDYTRWNKFRSWYSNNTFPDTMAQMVRTVHGGHSGKGQTLTEYNFDYSAETLNKVFRKLVDDALQGKQANNQDNVPITRNYPIALTDYPYETGLSIIGPRSKARPGELRRDFYRDVSNLAWHRALEAKSALSNRQDPAPPLPDEIRPNDLISFTVLYVIAVFVFGRALHEAVRMRQTAILNWDNPTGPWALLAPENKDGAQRGKTFPSATNLFDYLFGCSSKGLLRKSRAGTLDISYAFITATASIIGAILEFRDSSHRHQKILVVNAGGAITYGPSLSELSIDNQNAWAGAEFSVNHWMILNIKEVGSRWVLPIVCSVYALSFLYICHAFFLYSLRREHELDFWLIRTVYRPVKWSFLFTQRVIGSRMLRKALNEDQIVGISYETVYEGIFNKLAYSYGFERLMPEEMPKDRGTWSCFERFNIDRFLPNRIALQPVSSSEAELGFNFQSAIVRVSRNDIEKCAEVLAADRFGLLGRNQALTLMYTEAAAKAADRFVNENQLPDSEEIQQLSLIYYVRNVVVPDGDGPPIRREDIEFINVGDRIRGATGQEIDPDHVLAPGNGIELCSLVGYRPREGDAERVRQISHLRSMQEGNIETTESWDDEWLSGQVIYLELHSHRSESMD